MKISDYITLIRAGYSRQEIKQMEEAEQHEPQPLEPRDGMDEQQSTAAGTEGQDSAPEPETEEPREDARDAEIRRLTEELAASRRLNIQQNEKQPYGDDDYIKDVFARRG